MKNRYWRGVIAVAALSVAVGTSAQDEATPVVSPQAQAKAAAGELADRFESIVYLIAHSAKPLNPLAIQMEALAQAAMRLNPAEPRYSLLASQAALQAGDTDGAVQALQAYLTLVPNDEPAQVELIDLYVHRMQTADATLAYLRPLLQKTALPGPVRAHAAVLCAQTLLQRSQQDEAEKVLANALTIDPLCRPALRMKYALTRTEGGAHRCGLLLDMVRTNPSDPDPFLALGDELADVGLVTDSLNWYNNASLLYGGEGVARPPRLAKGAATELCLMDRPDDAIGVLDGYIASIPDDAEAWTIRLAVEQGWGTDPAAMDKLSRKAVKAVTGRFQAVRASVGATNATTQPSDAVGTLELTPTTSPSDEPVPELSGDNALLQRDGRPKAIDAYIAAAQDLAWLRLYFLHDGGAGTDALINNLSKLLHSDDPVLARLIGWKYLVQGRVPEAQQKLAGIAPNDPFAAVGMVLIDERTRTQADADARGRAALAMHPSGPGAAVLYAALHGRGIKVVPTQQAQVLQAAVNGFPKDWLNILARPQDFYIIHVDPITSTVAYDQAILARVTIENVSQYDLTLGDDSVIRPNFLIDGRAQGLLTKPFPQIAVERFSQRLILRAGQAASQVIRVDQGDLVALLRNQPDLPLELSFSLLVNPVRAQDGFRVGPAGYKVQFSSLIDRANVPITQSDDPNKLDTNRLNDLLGKALNAPPADRIYALDAIAAYGGRYLGAQGSDTAAKQALGKTLLDRIKRAALDPDPSVKSWATFYESELTPAADRPAMAQQMTASDLWTMRLLGLVTSQSLEDHGKAAALAMSSDADPIVKRYATGISEYLAAEAAAATQPSATRGSP